MNCSDDCCFHKSVSNRSIRSIGTALLVTVLLAGCSTAKVDDADNMEKATPAATSASEQPATVTLKSMNTVKEAPKGPPATVTLASMNKVPEEPKKEPAPEKKPPEILDDMHVVAEGQNLWVISALREVYDDGLLWPLIYKRNLDIIEDPDLIYPGQELAIERDNTDDDLNAAADHARSRGAWTVGPLESADDDYIKGAAN